MLVARQINICLWVLFVWGRERDNLDAPYRASELALLHVWEQLKPFIGKKGAQARAVASAFHQLIILHTTVAGLFLERKILPYVNRQHALSFAVNSGEPADVNLKMFDTLGRLALTGHWMVWLGRFGGRDLNEEQIAGLRGRDQRKAYLPGRRRARRGVSRFARKWLRSGPAENTRHGMQKRRRIQQPLCHRIGLLSPDIDRLPTLPATRSTAVLDSAFGAS